MRAFTVIVCTMVSLVAVGVAAQETPAPGEGNMVMVAPAEIKWVDAPPALPKGAKAAVLYGDPAKAGLFVMRVKFPANYKIPAHWHPADEIVTVLSGTFFMGHGDKLDTSAGKPLAAGAFVSMPAKMHHFAYTKRETVLQLSTVGPWGITYIDPADDPRTAKAAAK
jgi:quercetin dioxygenase-like cupin family protein